MRGALVAVAAALALAAPAAAADDPLLAQEWWRAAVGADRATPPGPGKPVTVIDFGVDLSHPEFAGRPATVALNPQEVHGPAVEESHGTAVASVIAAPANGVGVVGIYPQASLATYDLGVGGPELSAAGLDAAATLGPGVATFSSGFPAPGRDAVVQAGVDRAFARGVLVVAAAGNSGASSGFLVPPDLPHVLTVGATDQGGNVTTFSSRSPALDLVAPGVAMPVAVPTWRDPSGYTTLSGTSFAAPIVAGAAAWVWTVRPELDVTQLFDLMRFSADDIGPPGFDDDSGFGMLDVPKALAAAAPPPDPLEPNEDVAVVTPGPILPDGRPFLAPGTIHARLDASEDPRDVYRVSVPPHRTLTVGSTAAVAVSLWGPRTATVTEGGAARRRDLLGRGRSIRWRNAAGRAVTVYVAAALAPGRTDNAAYALTVRSTVTAE